MKKNVLYTKSVNSSNIEKKWLLVDASNISLGRLATHVASLIRGKNKPYFTPHVDCGDNVIVKNADKIKLTGNKWKEKIYSNKREFILVGKTQKKNVNKIIKFVEKKHSYECPCILFFNIDLGSKRFLKWIKTNS